MGDLADAHETLDAEGIGIAAISADPPQRSFEFASRIGARFPLLADQDVATATAYGVRHEGETLAVPATFIVSPDGDVTWRHVGETKPDRPALDRVRAEARRAREAAPPA